MSRKARGRIRPPFKIRIAPVFSTMKIRVVSPGGAVRSSGSERPSATRTVMYPDGAAGGRIVAGLDWLVSHEPAARRRDASRTARGFFTATSFR